MPHHNSQVLMRDAERIIDAMNEAMALDGTTDQRVELLLQSMVDLLEREAMATLLLLEDLDREPAPRVLDRFVYSPSADLRPIVADEDLQEAADTVLQPVMALVVGHIRTTIETPFTFIASDALNEDGWFETSFMPRTREHGFADAVCSAWAATPGRAVTMNIMRVDDDPPFTDADCQLVSLMLRAIAPFVDRELFEREDPLAKYELSERQKEVLLHLLHGDSEKQIAAALHRSVHTIHTYVKQLYTYFDVSSRGELMATFVDRAVLEAA